MALAAVCRRWNRLAYDGSLWTHISITHITTVTQLCFQLERSASRLLEVSIWLQPLHFTTKLREQCQTVLSEYWRVQDLDIDTFGPVGDPWPQELTAPLTSGKTWPHLLSLSLIDSSSDVNAVLQLDVDAPKLKTLVLEAVSTRQWPTLPRPALQSIQLRELGSASGIADAITNCPDLRHLDLRDNGEEHSAQNRSLHFPLPRSPTKLVNLDITWMTVDLKQLMSFLAFCPRLERLCLEVTTFDGYGDTLITDFRLPSLEVLRLELHDRPPSKPRILTALLPVVNAEKLRALTLSFVDMGSCEAILGGNLEDLSLTGIRCDAANLVRALSQCQQLRTLILHDLEISALDESLAEHAQRLPALRNASLTGYQSASVAGFVPDVQAENRCLVRLFLALVDGQGIPSLHIGVPLAAQEVAHICSELGDHDSMSLEVQDTWRGTRFKIGTAHRPPRMFHVQDLVESLRALGSTVGILALLTRLIVDLQSAASFFAALPPGAALPRLHQLIIEHGELSHPPPLRTVMRRIVSLHRDTSLECPCLQQVTLEFPHHAPGAVSKGDLDRFLHLFQSQQRVELKTVNVIVHADEASE